MGFTDLPLLSQIKGRLSWLDERQRVIAQNVANADTPGYAARDFNFADALKSATGSASSGSPLRMATSAGTIDSGRSNARHIPLTGGSGGSGSASAPATTQRATWCRPSPPPTATASTSTASAPPLPTTQCATKPRCASSTAKARL